MHGRITGVVLLACWLEFAALGRAEDLSVDFAEVIGRIRPLNGGNSGPLAAGGLIDLTEAHRRLRIPYTRLHDCHWPNPDVVDVHTVFPNASADPERPESYDFARTDEYIQAIIDSGAQPIYRLGESIEHTRLKRHVHPPPDPHKWARVCLGIVRHYNEGWAGGHRHGIRYWEIWNEPENRPVMWTGSDEDYLQLYEITAQTIKTAFPELKVGGPSLGDTGKWLDGRFEPSPFAIKFLAFCRDRKVPLDFFSWHLYTGDPFECVLRGRALRACLDAHGFQQTELHFNEWNYLPDRDWGPTQLAGQGRARDRFFDRIGGPEGAAFAACVLINLQDSPVAVANYYSMDVQGFGMFGPNGTPKHVFGAVEAFARLLETPYRLRSSGGDPHGLTILAGRSQAQSEVRVLIGSRGPDTRSLRLAVRNLPWAEPGRCVVRVVDAGHLLDAIGERSLASSGEPIKLEVQGPTVLLLELSARR